MKLAKLTDEEMNLEPLVLWEPNEPIVSDALPAQVAPAEADDVAPPIAPAKAEVCSISSLIDIANSRSLGVLKRTSIDAM